MNITENAVFFLIYPPGLEEASLLELKEKYQLLEKNSPLQIKSLIPGGIEIECPIHIGLKLNLVLKLPVRILLRLTEFKCRDFPKLFNKISKFNWSPFLLGQIPEIECSSKNSRLFDSRKIQKALGDGINQYYRHKPVKKKYLEHLESCSQSNLPKIYFRAQDDLVTLSLDTTGERLHLRGDREARGLAPIRENLAGALLLSLFSSLQNFEGEYTLIDPMCGSGTFLIEAKNFYNLSNERDFAFMHTPLALDSSSEQFKIQWDQKNLVNHTIGFDISSEILNQARQNDPNGDYRIQDLMDDSHFNIKNPLVILNPPYGIRLGENIQLDYFLRVIKAVKKKFTPIKLGIIIPAEYKIYSNNEWTILKSIPFKNGGIDVFFYVIKYN